MLACTVHQSWKLCPWGPFLRDTVTQGLRWQARQVQHCQTTVLFATCQLTFLQSTAIRTTAHMTTMFHNINQMLFVLPVFGMFGIIMCRRLQHDLQAKCCQYSDLSFWGPSVTLWVRTYFYKGATWSSVALRHLTSCQQGALVIWSHDIGYIYSTAWIQFKVRQMFKQLLRSSRCIQRASFRKSTLCSSPPDLSSHRVLWSLF